MSWWNSERHTDKQKDEWTDELGSFVVCVFSLAMASEDLVLEEGSWCGEQGLVVMSKVFVFVECSWSVE
ncbi:hypothetical protein [Alkalicoccobacillus plakortidis]|uniref:Uncharacterized protein n=1 Tax=Alkalicoccobacillus plakortidis TaxID=444060 RepID=A0ABT0XHZ4_9BACI|nr:hypothetical protein [Alkalicoccobacillus plakortidis]MCM2674819.1 hypothetical protein [Alkalicoccobacillus plakortidis]